MPLAEPVAAPASEASGGSTARLKWTAHPIVDELIPPLSEEQLKAWVRKPGGFDAALEYWKRHESMIREAEEDPLRRGFELPFWYDFRELLARRDELYALGGNGPGKTEIGGKLAVESLVEARGRRVLCVALNENSSKQLQQAAVYKYLPASCRQVNERLGPRRRDTIKNITYSQKNGFTEGTFVLPNRAQCWFKTVEQYERDVTSFEGPEYDLVWIDEPAPAPLLETLRYRVGKRRGKILFTFTAVNGFDANCAMVLTGARLLKSLPMNWVWDLKSGKERVGRSDPAVRLPELSMTEPQVKGVPAGHMPYMMQPLDPRQGVIFLWTHWNVFLPRSQDNAQVPALFDKCKGKTKQTVRTRLFGWAEKITGCQFPQFSSDVHVVPPGKVPLPGEGTDYMAVDPQTARSYFALWVRVDALGRKFVYDESPRLEEGAWVDDNETRGDGQRIFAGRGVNFYKEHIRAREREHGQEAHRRKGDPRAFATESAAKEGGQNLFELFLNEDSGPDRAPMYFEPAKVRQTILLDLEKVNAELAYDEDKPISIENEPKLYISERCQNLIRAMFNWSPDQGSDSPWKDPVDALRYLFDEPLYFVDPNVPEVVGGRGW
jgi:hypothetical protein